MDEEYNEWLDQQQYFYEMAGSADINNNEE
jgi:hypothetical protein